ncbi:MAG: hypothetical protein ACRC3Z_01115 [Phocaeicola sp.]
MNKFSIILVTATLVASLFACSNHDDDSLQGELTSAYLQLDLSRTTRAIEAPIGSTTAPVNSVHLYFHDGAAILKTIIITHTSSPSIANLTAGTKISDIPSTANQVTVFGNIPSTLSVPTAGTINSVKQMVASVASQTPSNVLLRGNDAMLTVVPTTGAPAWTSGADVGNDLYAEVSIAPAFARVEIEGVASNAASGITAYGLDGIFLNNIYEGLKLDGSADGTLQSNGTNPNHYSSGAGVTPVYNNDGVTHQMVNANATAVAGGSSLEVTAGTGMRWAFQVVPNNASNGNDQLQLVLRIVGITSNTFNFSGDQFLTVRGFIDATGTIVPIEAGKIYTISKADFIFDENSLNATPNTTTVGVYLRATVTPWSVVSVKPNI